jgi:hypothetical protein
MENWSLGQVFTDRILSVTLVSVDTHDWAAGGRTRDDNLGSTCRHDHCVKHDGGWQVSQPAAGHLIWTSRLGVQYHVCPPLIIQPLPAPEPRPPPFREPPEPPPF